MIVTPKKAWILVVAYALLVYTGLAFTPSLSDFLVRHDWLSLFITGSYAAAILWLAWFCWFRQGLHNPETYAFLILLFLLFLAGLQRMEVTTDRLHFLEHGLFFAFAFAALRFSNEGVTLYGRAFLLSLVFGALDEAIQGWLPNRTASWQDLWTNIFAYYLAAGSLSLVRKREVPLLEKRDSFFLAGSLIGLVFWIKMAPKIPPEYFLPYCISSLFLLLPLALLLYWKKQFYQWPLEALFYLFFLTLTGVLAFSYSILGIDPLDFL